MTAGITPWNFPSAMVDAQVRAGARRRVHDGAQARRADAALGARDRRAGRGGGHPAGRVLRRDGRCLDAPAIGAELTVQPAVRKLGFTGSTEVGKLLMRQCADHVKKVSLELGGNAPFIVFDDADLEIAVESALVCKFRNSGQTCISANRMLVQAGIYDAFVARFTDGGRGAQGGRRLRRGRPGRPADRRVRRSTRCEAHVADAREGGAELVTGGERIGGQFFRPSILTGVTAEMRMSCEETFGPVAAIARFETEERGGRDRQRHARTGSPRTT